MNSERVRVRRILESAGSAPSLDNIARLAELSARGRSWLSEQAAALIRSSVTYENQGFTMRVAQNGHKLILREVFSTLIWASGGMPYRPSLSKFQNLVEAAQEGGCLRKTAGRCLIEVKNNKARFTPEDRRSKQIRREEIKLASTPASSYKLNPMQAFERFRPATDDAVFEAVEYVTARSNGVKPMR